MRILVTGAYGLLGTVLCKYLNSKGHKIFKQGRGENAEWRSDLSKSDDAYNLLKQTEPDVIINLIAMTNVDECEKNPQAAYRANVRSIAILSEGLKNLSCHLIHISSDQVYDGPGPHAEFEVDPCNLYGLTKYAGELHANKVGATVLRTNFVGRSHVPGRISFTDWLVKAFRQHEKITLFNDLRFSAMHTSKLCEVLEITCSLRPVGVFNVGSRDSMCKASFGLELAKLLILDSSQVNIAQTADQNLVARRPLDMSLMIHRFEQEFRMTLPTMSQTLKCVAADYNEDITDATA